MNRGKNRKKHGINPFKWLEFSSWWWWCFTFNFKHEALHHPKLPSFFPGKKPGSRKRVSRPSEWWILGCFQIVGCKPDGRRFFGFSVVFFFLRVFIFFFSLVIFDWFFFSVIFEFIIFFGRWTMTTSGSNGECDVEAVGRHGYNMILRFAGFAKEAKWKPVLSSHGLSLRKQRVFFLGRFHRHVDI